MIRFKHQIPFYGILVFVLAYYIASRFYPGGNVQNSMQKGFDWIHNYWCDLLETKAINGEANLAKPIALVALFLLLTSLGFFFYFFPKFFPAKRNVWDKIIVNFGVISVLLTSLITTDFHDYTIGISSALGIVALIGIFISLKHHFKKNYFWFGWFSLLVLVANNVMYYTRIGEWYLPLMQKIGFATLLFWITWVTYGFREQSEKTLV